MSIKEIRVALIRHQFMGIAHSNAYRNASMWTDLPVKITMKCLCANDTMENLKSFADKYGWKSCDNEWRNVVKRENVDLISIATPNYLHKEIAIEAAKNNATRFVTGLTFNEVSGNLQTLIKERPIDSNNANSPKGKVTVDDVAQFLVNFEDGATGCFESTRLATGRKNFNSIEVNREKGSLVWNFEDQNYLFFMTINSHIKKLVLRK